MPSSARSLCARIDFRRHGSGAVKYRGSHHGTNEYSLLIDANGINVWPVTSLTLQDDASSERVPSGLSRSTRRSAARATIAEARSSSRGRPASARRRSPRNSLMPLVSAGSGVLCFLFEESTRQVIRNMRAAGIDSKRGLTWPASSACRSAFPSRAWRRISPRCIAPSSTCARHLDLDPMINLSHVRHTGLRACDAHAHDRLRRSARSYALHESYAGRHRPGFHEDRDLFLDGYWVMPTLEETRPSTTAMASRLKYAECRIRTRRGSSVLTNHGIEILPTDPYRASGEIVMSEAKHELRLYVAGRTLKAIRAFANLQKICEEHLAGRYGSKSIDLLKDPKLGMATRYSLIRPWCAG